jgi:hypothetical protein
VVLARMRAKRLDASPEERPASLIQVSHFASATVRLLAVFVATGVFPLLTATSARPLLSLEGDQPRHITASAGRNSGGETQALCTAGDANRPVVCHPRGQSTTRGGPGLAASDLALRLRSSTVHRVQTALSSRDFPFMSPGRESGTQESASSPAFQRPDCELEQAVCTSDCYYSADQQVCISASCDPAFKACIAVLPFGAVASLPAACISSDQAAFRLIEQQGVILDMDPTLLAEAYITLIKARIACRAGLFDDALHFYDEIETALQRKTATTPDSDRVGR